MPVRRRTHFRRLVRGLSPAKVARVMASLTPDEALTAEQDWVGGWAHEGQGAPPGDWRTWVVLAGRGFGKTRAGAEWIAHHVRHAAEPLRIALVAASFDEARSVMIEGESGLLAVAAEQIDAWVPSLRLLRFTGGSEARLFTGCAPDKLRGPEHHLAWCDELAKWARGVEAWDNLQLGLRAGRNPQALVTTTPRPCEALRRILAQPHARSIGRTHDNPHLPPAFVAAVTALYEGTRLARQELDGELLPDVHGALWTVELLEACRTPVAATITEPPLPERQGTEGRVRGTAAPVLQASFTRTIIGVDPPAGGGTCGIVVCALDTKGTAHVLADHSVTGRSPEQWAQAVAAAAEAHDAALVVAEANQGGKMVEAVLRAAGVGARVKLVHAAQGKSARADPIATLFEAGKVRLSGRFPQLEAELCGLIAGGGYEGPGSSPDRADAMVWALTELMLGKGERRLGVRVL